MAVVIERHPAYFNSLWEVVLPVGAIAFGLFMISLMLEKEVAKFDADKAKELQLTKNSYSVPTITGLAASPALSPAISTSCGRCWLKSPI